MPFGQVVIGPPGSGKTTYCNGIQQYLTGLGRKVAIVNLDPANDTLPYEADVDVSELVHLEEVMERCRLGPNGGLLYCMDYLHENLDWLRNKLSQYEKENYYFLFDCPGQVELFTTSSSFRGILTELTGKWHYRLAAIHLVDAHLCTDGSKYLSALLLSLTTMLYLELPHINVLSKMDLIQAYGDLQFNLDFYTEVQDLQHLVNAMSPSRFSRKYRKLSEGLCDVVDGYGLLSFHPLAIQDKESVQQLMGLVDKCNGYVFAGLASHNPYPPEMLYGSSVRASDQDLWRDMQDKYVEESEHAGLLGQVMEIERDKGQERER